MIRRRLLFLLGPMALLSLPAAADNPPAPGFDLSGSDPQAIAIADQVMERMGGREAWDRTRYITWNFFGRRRHLWDKHTGDLRIEGIDRETEKPFVILMNLQSRKGRAWSGDAEITDPEELAQRLDFGEAVWINDSYWMFMPYKLKDSGVTLTYLGSEPMLDGRPAAVLQLTFKGVGRTPQNKYRVYVAEDSGLVEQWDFFDSADDPDPRFQNPWHDWQTYGSILLSANRGDTGHTDIAVFSELPADLLESPEPVDWDSLIPSR
jgi:hypothetical protein